MLLCCDKCKIHETFINTCGKTIECHQLANNLGKILLFDKPMEVLTSETHWLRRALIEPCLN